MGPVRAEMKMKSSPMMEGFALKPGIRVKKIQDILVLAKNSGAFSFTGQIPPGAIIAPDGKSR